MIPLNPVTRSRLLKPRGWRVRSPRSQYPIKMRSKSHITSLQRQNHSPGRSRSFKTESLISRERRKRKELPNSNVHTAFVYSMLRLQKNLPGGPNLVRVESWILLTFLVLMCSRIYGHIFVYTRNARRSQSFSNLQKCGSTTCKLITAPSTSAQLAGTGHWRSQIAPSSSLTSESITTIIPRNLNYD